MKVIALILNSIVALAALTFLFFFAAIFCVLFGVPMLIRGKNPIIEARRYRINRLYRIDAN